MFTKHKKQVCPAKKIDIWGKINMLGHVTHVVFKGIKQTHIARALSKEVSITQKILSSTSIKDIKGIAINPIVHLSAKVKPCTEALDTIFNKHVVPHLQSKTDYTFDYQHTELTQKDSMWLQPDKENLITIRALILNTHEFPPTMQNFLSELIDGLIIHTNYRLQILELNSAKITPENGPLIRMLYRIAEKSSEDVATKTITQLGIANDDIFSKSVFQSIFRNLTRGLIRIGGSQTSANHAAAMALETSALTFPEKFKTPLIELGVYHLAKNAQHHSNQAELEFRSTLKTSLGSYQLQQKHSVKDWINKNFLGLSYLDLIEKNMSRGFNFQHSMEEISKSASKPNKKVNESQARSAPTKVPPNYVNQIARVPLFGLAFDPEVGVKYIEVPSNH